MLPGLMDGDGERRGGTIVDSGAPHVVVPLPPRVKACSFRRLVVGGGHRADFPALGPCDVSLNIREDHLPDIVADVACIPLEDASMDEVYFEKMPYFAFTGSRIQGLREAVRVLKPGGQLLIETGIAAPDEEIVGELRRLGCVGLVVQAPGTGPLSVRARRGQVETAEDLGVAA